MSSLGEMDPVTVSSVRKGPLTVVVSSLGSTSGTGDSKSCVIDLCGYSRFRAGVPIRFLERQYPSSGPFLRSSALRAALRRREESACYDETFRPLSLAPPQTPRF